MSEEENSVSDAPVNVDGVNDQDSTNVAGGNDTVKYDTYKRTLNEAKKAKSQLSEMQERLQQLELEKASAEGNKDELISKLQSQVDDYKSKYTQAHGAFASGRAMDVIIDEANKMGVASTSLLRRVVGERLGDLEFDDEYRPNAEQIKMLLDDVRKEEPLLFSKQGPRVADHNLNPQYGDEKKPLKQLSKDELDEQWARLSANKRR